jgi:type IV secretory pathway VirB4 component
MGLELAWIYLPRVAIHANAKLSLAITFFVWDTGSGKSVTMNSIIRTAVESGAFVMVVDVGHSYEMLCKHYFKGSYFSFDIGQPENQSL